MPSPTPETWARIRHAYEHTRQPIEDICAEHGISSGTLRDRMRRWNWTRRQRPVPCEGPPAIAMPAITVEPRRETSKPAPAASCEATPTPNPSPLFIEDGRERPFAWGGSETDTPADPAATAALIAQRLQGALARVLPAIETTLARLTAPSQHPRETEQAARTLGVLVRTLRELNALAGQHAPQGDGQGGNDDRDDDGGSMPDDIDQFRRDLARRIEAFVAELQEAESRAAAPDGDGGGAAC